MLRQDMSGRFRFYVRGEQDELKRFTIELTWYHSALAEVGSVNEMDDGTMVLNLIARPENYGDGGNEIVERHLRRLASKFHVVAFATWDEYEEREGA